MNFFGPEEEARQGGSDLANNPLALVKRFPQGLLLQVGSGPLEAVTPGGEHKLAEATRRMPTLGQPETPAEQELITINGVRGFFDQVDNSFWVSKHIPLDAELTAKTVEKLKTLVGQGEPPVAQVYVLFSRLETAEKSCPMLTAAGIRTWYVDLRTGQPREI